MVLHLPAAPAAPCVIACHGLGASKDSDKYRLLGADLPEHGLALARFDFRGAGESSGRPEDATVATRLEDLAAVEAWLARHPRLDPDRVGVVGSSMGGFVALHAAARRARPLPVVTWNAPATLRGLLERGAAAGEVGPGLLAELAGGAYIDAPEGVRGLRVIQGGGDDVVPPAHAERIFRAAREPRDLRVIPGADHRFSEMGDRRQALALTREWLLEWLCRRRLEA